MFYPSKFNETQIQTYSEFIDRHQITDEQGIANVIDGLKARVNRLRKSLSSWGDQFIVQSTGSDPVLVDTQNDLKEAERELRWVRQNIFKIEEFLPWVLSTERQSFYQSMASCAINLDGEEASNFF